MTIPRKQNVAGYTDEMGRFRPIRDPQFVGSPKRRATVKAKAKYSRAKAGDLGKRRQSRALEDPFDRAIRLEREAKAAKERERQRIARSIELDVYGEGGERSRGRTLAQFVRASGGIRRTKYDSGELSYLTQKESGRRGLVVDRGGKTLDGMYQAARESGYDVRDMDDLIDKLVKEAKGGKPLYKTHGYLDYRDNPSELRVMQITPNSYGVFLRKYLLKKFRTKAAAEVYAKSIRSRAKNPASAARLAKSAIAVFDTDLDLDLDVRDVRRLEKGEKALRRNPKVKDPIRAASLRKKNPADPIGLFANAAVGIASALQIKEYMNRPKAKAPARRKTNGKTTAKRRNPAKNPTTATVKRCKKILSEVKAAKSYFLMPFPDGVYLSDGDNLGRRFASAASARAYAKAQGIKLVANPKPNGVRKAVTRSANPKRRYSVTGTLNGRKVQFFETAASPAAAIREVRKHQGDVKSAKAVILTEKMALAWFENHDKGPKRNGVKKAVASAKKPNPKTPQWLRDRKKEAKTRLAALAKQHRTTQANILLAMKMSASGSMSFDRAIEVVTDRKRKAKANPKTTARRRTFEMFQGRPASMVRPMEVSRFAPARMDQLGDLIELKLHDGQVIKPNPKRFKLCAAGGKMWIAGGKFAKANPAGKTNELNPIGRVVHVVYGTRKPHHGDHKYTHYIHRLGEDSGHLPTLAVDREGYPVIRGGKYKIESRGIVN